MKNKILFGVSLFLSFFLFISFVGFTANDFLTVGNSYFWQVCYSCPFIFALLFTLISFCCRPEKAPILKYLPLAINILTVLIGIAFIEFNHRNPDFGFLRLYKDYVSATILIENGQIPIDGDGFALLPETLVQTSLSGYVYVTKDANLTTVYFLYDTDVSDGYSWGYLYRSDGSEPPITDKRNWEKCYHWRPIKPVTLKWFYCEANQIYVFPGRQEKQR